MGPHWVLMKPQKGSSRACRSSKSVHLLGAWSFVVLSLRDVRGWEPVQPELPQELGDPAPRPSLLTLHLRGLYEHKQACPVGPLLGRDLSPGPGLPLTLFLQPKGGGLKFLPTRKMFRGDGHLAAGASSAPPQGQGPERSQCLCCCWVPRLGREVPAVLPEAYTAVSLRTWVFSWEERQGTVVGEDRPHVTQTGKLRPRFTGSWGRQGSDPLLAHTMAAASGLCRAPCPTGMAVWPRGLECPIPPALPSFP